MVDSAERLDESIHITWAASQVFERGGRLTLDEVYARVEIDPERPVRAP